MARRFMGPAVVVAVFAFLLAWSWGKRADVLIDFGRELYVPWQIAAWKALYRDIAWFNGTLSPHVNALLFRAFGVGLRQLAVANAALTLGIAFMVHAILRELSDRVTAAVGAVSFLLFFAIAQFMPRTNYTFLAPYSHEMIHGSALGLLALLLLAVHVHRGGGRGSSS